MTVCELRRHSALQRLNALLRTGNDPGQPEILTTSSEPGELVDTEAGTTQIDFERLAQDRISVFIAQRFAGHGLACLVSKIFEARGMTTFQAPEGPDGGIDVLAGGGPLGMDSPRICVQVKSGDTPIDVRVIRELQGVLGRIGANQGLIASWAGMNKKAEAEIRREFFQVRVWNADDLIREFTDVYDQLPDDLQAELPLKRVWTLALGDEGEI